MPRDLLDRLSQWKTRFGPFGAGRLESLLAVVARRKFRTAAELIRLHEALLFLRAYPRSPQVARLADAALAGFAGRIAAFDASGGDLDPFEDPEISGIAGTSLSAVFTYEFARRLALRHPRSLEIAWDRYDEIDKLGPVLARLLPLFAEDWPVEAHAPSREWIAAARPRGGTDLAWLLTRLAALPIAPRERAACYESLGLPLTWQFGARMSRSNLRLPGRSLFCHREPLLRRGDISLAAELQAPPLPVRRLPPPEARKILDLILDASAMRFRELYGFSHPDQAGVFHADAGRGVQIYFFGVPPEWRLPLRAYHAGMFFKNGVPAGYVELLSLFERAEVGFNLYYTFREGESAWLYARILRLFNQVLGVKVFSVDPYQIGLENPEAVQSGAFWFYRKLGFRPVRPEAAALVNREEIRIRRTPGYRSSKRTLEKLARSYILFEGPSAETGVWDNFRVRNLGLAAEQRGADALVRTRPPGRVLPLVVNPNAIARVLSLIPEWTRWTTEEKLAVAKIVRAKESASEARYLRLMQRHPRLRAAFLALGSSAPLL
jgi:hypothetical protein